MPWGGELEVLAQPDVQVVGVTSENAGTHFHEGDTVAVVGVHVGVDLEDKTGEFLLVRLHEALVRLAGKRAGSDLDETVQHLADTEVVQCRSEEHGATCPSRYAARSMAGILPERVRGLPAACRPSARRYARRVRRN